MPRLARLLCAALIGIGLAGCDSAPSSYLDDNRDDLRVWFACTDFEEAPVGGSVQGALTDEDCYGYGINGIKHSADHYIVEIAERTMAEIRVDMGGGARPAIALRTVSNDRYASPRQTLEPGGRGQVARMEVDYLPGVSVITVTTLGAGESGPYTLSIREL